MESVWAWLFNLYLFSFLEIWHKQEYAELALSSSQCARYPWMYRLLSLCYWRKRDDSQASWWAVSVVFLICRICEVMTSSDMAGFTECEMCACAACSDLIESWGKLLQVPYWLRELQFFERWHAPVSFQYLWFHVSPSVRPPRLSPRRLKTSAADTWNWQMRVVMDAPANTCTCASTHK